MEWFIGLVLLFTLAWSSEYQKVGGSSVSVYMPRVGGSDAGLRSSVDPRAYSPYARKSRPELETVNKEQPASWLFAEFFNCAKVVGATSSKDYLDTYTNEPLSLSK